MECAVIPDGHKQCFGSGSAWTRIRFVSCIPNADPDPAADKLAPKAKKNSYNLELFD